MDEIATLLQRVEDAHARFSRVPILPDIATQLDQEVVVSSVYGTNAIEGGTLSEEETAEVIETGNATEEKERRVINLREAYDLADRYAARCLEPESDNVRSGSVILADIMLTDLHHLITEGLSHPTNIPGQYRDDDKSRQTFVGDSNHGGRYRPPKSRGDIEILVDGFIHWINDEEILALSPLIRAPLAHLYFELIHPFADGNGRVGRVIEALIVKCAGFKYAHWALAKYYLENIDEYFSVFNIARKDAEKKRSFPNTVFVTFFLAGLLSVLNKLHDRVNWLTGIILYEHQVHSRHQARAINDRQFTIISTLRRLGGVTTHSLKEVQSFPWYQALYKKLTARTRERDLNKLVEQGLISITEDRQLMLRIPGLND